MSGKFTVNELQALQLLLGCAGQGVVVVFFVVNSYNGHGAIPCFGIM
jgi:hypothetical protein